MKLEGAEVEKLAVASSLPCFIARIVVDLRIFVIFIKHPVFGPFHVIILTAFYGPEKDQPGGKAGTQSKKYQNEYAPHIKNS